MVSVEELTIFEKRLVALIRALLMEPEIIILEYSFDEISESEKCWLAEKLSKLKAEATVLYILSSEKDIIENARV